MAARLPHGYGQAAAAEIEMGLSVRAMIIRSTEALQPVFGSYFARLLIMFPIWLGSSVNGRSGVQFYPEIAAILYKHCTPCHRQGQPAPFQLIEFEDARRKALQIVEVTQKRLMPPWLAEPGEHRFVNERGLSQREINLLDEWNKAGCPLGEPPINPQKPPLNTSWELGIPDMVLELPQVFELNPEGKDIYRNFVIPIPGSSRRFVRAIEFSPGSNRAVHHAFVTFDTSRLSRLMATGSPAGFDGMVLPETARMPEGQLLSWQPGRTATPASGGIPWPLESGSDLVLQLHLKPSGKVERIQPKVGFYFSDFVQGILPVRLNLSQLHLQIPPSDGSYVVKNEFELPVNVKLLGLLPHLHYLGKQVLATAILPEGDSKELLRIRQWDFNWQTDYTYKTPVWLPKGTQVRMQFTYDNSSENPRNPNQPPRQVVYGTETTDEMAELWTVMQPESASDRERLVEALSRKLTKDSYDYNEFRVRQNPNDAVARTRLARALVVMGKEVQALDHLKEALKVKPDHDKAYYEIGAILMRQGRFEPAEKSFLATVRFNPNDYQAHGSLGVLYLNKGQFEAAEKALLKALEINPQDEIAQKYLELSRRKPEVLRAQ